MTDSIVSYNDVLQAVSACCSLDEGGVTSQSVAGTNILNSSGKSWTADVFKNCVVHIYDGPGTGQVRTILHNELSTLVIDLPWTNTITPQSRFRIMPVPGTDIPVIAANLLLLMADIGNASGSTLGSILAILGNPLQSLATMIGYEGDTSLADKLPLARAALIDQCTAARLGELDPGNIPSDIDWIASHLAVAQGVTYRGTVTTYTGATQFESTDLIGYPDHYFEGWYVLAIDAAGAAPQRQLPEIISSYTGATGAFTHTAFDSGNLAVDDEVLIIPASLYSSMAGLFNGSVYFDAAGVAGTEYPIGSPTMPCSNVANTQAIATNINSNRIHVKGLMTLAQAWAGYQFTGDNLPAAGDSIALAGQDVSGSTFQDILISGAQGGAGLISIWNGVMVDVSEFNGFAHNTSIYNTLGLKDACYVDVDFSHAAFAALTITVQAPTRAAFKDLRGTITLTAQDGGETFICGMNGYLTIDAMTAGTITICMDAGTITINGNCTGGTINIEGIANVTGAGGGVVINNNTESAKIDSLATEVAKLIAATRVMDFWSDLDAALAIDSTAGDESLPNIVVADLPAGATVVRAIMMFKYAKRVDSSSGVNKTDAAQTMSIDSDIARTSVVTAIDIPDDSFHTAADATEGGDVVIGDNDVSAEVVGNGTYYPTWELADVDGDSLTFYDVQVGLRIWYTL